MVMIGFLFGSVSRWLLGQVRRHFGPVQGLSFGYSGLALAYVIGAVALAFARVRHFDRDQIRGPS